MKTALSFSFRCEQNNSNDRFFATCVQRKLGGVILHTRAVAGVILVVVPFPPGTDFCHDGGRRFLLREQAAKSRCC